MRKKVHLDFMAWLILAVRVLENRFQALDFDFVILAQAGIQKILTKSVFEYRAKGLEGSATYLDSRLRGNDKVTSMAKETRPEKSTYKLEVYPVGICLGVLGRMLWGFVIMGRWIGY